MRAKFDFLDDLTVEELGFLCEATSQHPTMLARMEALAHLRAAGVPVPPRTLTQEVRDAFAKFEARAFETRVLH